jgi:DNA polymerase-3 subunit delta
MPPLTLEAVYRTLKRGEPALVYYLTGEADVLKEELATAIVSMSVDEAARDFNLDIRSAGDLDGEGLHALVETLPILAERRAVVLKNLEQWRTNAAVWEVLFRYLEHPSATTVLILIHGSGEKPLPRVATSATHVNIEALSPDLLRRWATARAQKLDLELLPDAADHLIATVAGDLGSLAMEIDKMSAAVPAGTPVTVEKVSELAGVRRGETLADWIEAVLRRDPVSAVALLAVVLPLPGVTGVRMVTALGTALLGTRAARAFLDRGTSSREIADQLFRFLRQTRPQGVGVWSDEAKRWTRAAALWTGPELEATLRDTYEADRALKNTSLTDERGMLANLLFRIAPRQSAARTGVAA